MTTSLNEAGLGLRRALLPDLLTMDDRAVDFLDQLEGGAPAPAAHDHG